MEEKTETRQPRNTVTIRSKLNPILWNLFLNNPLSLIYTHTPTHAHTLPASWKNMWLPSLLGFPRTFLTSALVGFVPRARRTSPTWLKVILQSPVLSYRRNASLNSARSKKHLVAFFLSQTYKGTQTSSVQTLLYFITCQSLKLLSLEFPFSEFNVNPLLTFLFGTVLKLLLLSHFSRVRLCATPSMAAHQAPPSLVFSRQEHWSGLPLPSPMHESEK